MAKRVNYGFEKRQRELKKQKKNQEKAERRKLEKKTSASPAEEQDEGTLDKEPLDSQ